MYLALGRRSGRLDLACVDSSSIVVLNSCVVPSPVLRLAMVKHTAGGGLLVIVCCQDGRAFAAQVVGDAFGLLVDLSLGYPLSQFVTDSTSSILVSDGSHCDLLVWDLQQILACRMQLPLADNLIMGLDDHKDFGESSSDAVSRILEPCFSLCAHKAAVSSIAISDSSDMLLSGSRDGSIIVWDILQRRPTHVLTGHTSVVNTLAFHPSNVTMAASGASDFHVRIWLNDQCSVNMNEHTYSVIKVAFNLTGSSIASLGKDKSLIIADVCRVMPTRKLLLPSSACTFTMVHSSSDVIFIGFADGSVQSVPLEIDACELHLVPSLAANVPGDSIWAMGAPAIPSVASGMWPIIYYTLFYTLISVSATVLGGIDGWRLHMPFSLSLLFPPLQPPRLLLCPEPFTTA